MNPYILPLQKDFIKNSNKEDAFFMKKYLKNQFDFFGVKSPLRKELQRQHFKEYGFPDNENLEEIITELWNMPEREMQYIAIFILEKNIKTADKSIVSLLEYIMGSKSWWDSIDGIASSLVGGLFKKYPELIEPYTKKWINSNNMWFQRTAILFQLKYKNNTNTILLEKMILKCIDSKEFFIRKAIGWILREYSKTNAKWVKEFLSKYKNELAPFSIREAEKWMNKK